ncbi:MAG: porin family protein [Hyphomonadaceae bacterium]|nr:porin family protein [Hyphomonadaceae bacterium]MBX3509653.1 porin family protein [Hyphomonadaceae bacterium]
MRTLGSAFLAAAIAATLTATPAVAQGYYGSASLGGVFLNDSDNSGSFTRNFLTGTGTTIPNNTPLPAGTGVGWTTEFDTGYTVSAAIGRRFSNGLRGEIELAYQNNDVDTHNNVQAAGIPLDTQDVGVLISGAPRQGATVGAVVADGRGSIDTTFLMANLYYDFPQYGAFTPYVGGGLGVGFVNVEYAPSGVGIVDDDDTVFAYQAVAGASYALNDNMALFAQYRYRATEDVGTEVDLFPASLDVENRASVIEAGLRFNF